MEKSMIPTCCGNCSVKFSFPDNRLEQEAKCPKCKAAITLIGAVSPVVLKQAPPPVPQASDALLNELRQLRQEVKNQGDAKKDLPKIFSGMFFNFFLPSSGHFVQGRIWEGFAWLFVFICSAAVTVFIPRFGMSWIFIMWILCLFDSMRLPVKKAGPNVSTPPAS